jgi:hypothetical protein
VWEPAEHAVDASVDAFPVLYAIVPVDEGIGNFFSLFVIAVLRHVIQILRELGRASASHFDFKFV